MLNPWMSLPVYVRNSGMVLLMTLLLMGLLSCFLVSLMQEIFIFWKVDHGVQKRHQYTYQLEAVARYLMVGEIDESCVIKVDDPNRIVAQLKRTKGCSYVFEHRKFHYLISDLGPEPCLQVSWHQKIYGTKHRLISVMHHQNILQIRVVQRSKRSECLSHQGRFIHEGVTSWRSISASA